MTDDRPLWILGIAALAATAGYFVWKATAPATSTGHPGLPTSGLVPPAGVNLLQPSNPVNITKA